MSRRLRKGNCNRMVRTPRISMRGLDNRRARRRLAALERRQKEGKA